jgi:DnaK suppressor protein
VDPERHPTDPVLAMRAIDRDEVRTELQRRRRAILNASRHAAAAIDGLRGAERDPEAEEGSQSEQEQLRLAELGEMEQREIARIDAALERLAAGAYGRCRDCGDEIERGRLEAVPFVLECTECAARREEEARRAEAIAGKPRRSTPA